MNDSDMNIENMYSISEQRTKTIVNLSVFGIRLFKEAYIVKNIELAKSLLSNSNIIQGSSNTLNFNNNNQLIEFSFQKMIDDVRILACFENLIKANLIHKGYVVHEIKSPKKEKSNQRNIPIPFSHIQGFTLSDKTLSLSTLLDKKGYSELIDLDKEILVELKTIKKARNRIHFYNHPELIVSLESLEMLRHMNEYVDKIIEIIKDIQNGELRSS